MKIAVVTHDGETVSQHFGRAPYYKIYTVEEGVPVGVEMRRRGTGHFDPNVVKEKAHDDHVPADVRGHGYEADARSKHASMATELSDCDVLVAGGMGRGAWESFLQAGLEVILTDMREINDVVNAWTGGTLRNLADERTH